MLDTKICLSAIRANAKKTQTEVADAMGVTKMTISNWETGRAMPDFDQVIKFCKVCDDFPIENVKVP